MYIKDWKTLYNPLGRKELFDILYLNNMPNLSILSLLLVFLIQTNAHHGDIETSNTHSDIGHDSTVDSGPVPDPNSNTGSISFDLDDHLSSFNGGETADFQGVGFVGTVPDDDTPYDGDNSNNGGHTFDSSSDFENIPGVSYVGDFSDDIANDAPLMDNIAAGPYDSSINTGRISFDFDDHVGSLPGVNFVDGEGTDVNLPGVKFVGTVDGDIHTDDGGGSYEHTFPNIKNGQHILDETTWNTGDFPGGIYGLSDNMIEHVPSNEDTGKGNGDDILYSDDGNQDNSGVSTYVPETTSDNTGNYDTTTTPTPWNPMNCYVGDKIYEEGDGTMSTINPCMLNICEAGKMNQYPTACYMDGICHNEGTKWKSNCIEYTCRLTNSGFRAIETNKGCVFQRKNGPTRCLKHGQTIRDGPCKKRQCKISKFNDYFVAELPLVKNVGGCGFAKGCRSPGEVWKYRCVTKKCVSDGYNFYKVPLHANCIRRGRCYSGGQSYTTPRTCVTRTCFVNNIINIAWFEETDRGCRFGGICIKEGEKRTKRCKEFTCTKIRTSTGKVRMVMKKTNKNVCKQKAGY